MAWDCFRIRRMYSYFFLKPIPPLFLPLLSSLDSLPVATWWATNTLYYGRPNGEFVSDKVYLRGELSLSVSQLAAKGKPSIKRSAATNTSTLEGEFAVRDILTTSLQEKAFPISANAVYVLVTDPTIVLVSSLPYLTVYLGVETLHCCMQNL